MSKAEAPSWRLSVKHLLVALGLVLILAVVFLGIVGWIGSERALNPELHESAQTPADYPELTFESITFESSTGVNIDGRFFPGSHDAVVIMSHGFSDQQDQVLPQADILQNAGYSVLTINGRNRSSNGDAFSTLGVHEQDDLRSAVDYVIERDDVSGEHIGVYGISLGAATSILTASSDTRIDAVVSEGAFSDPERVISSSFQQFIGLPAFPFAPVTVAIAEWRAGESLSQAQPIEVVADIAPRPILFIHGLDDESVPPDHGERLYAAAGEPKEIWWVPDAHHTDAYEVAGDEYSERLVDFFDNNLLD